MKKDNKIKMTCLRKGETGRETGNTERERERGEKRERRGGGEWREERGGRVRRKREADGEKGRARVRLSGYE